MTTTPPPPNTGCSECNASNNHVCSNWSANSIGTIWLKEYLSTEQRRDVLCIVYSLYCFYTIVDFVNFNFFYILCVWERVNEWVCVWMLIWFLLFLSLVSCVTVWVWSVCVCDGWLFLFHFQFSFDFCALIFVLRMCTLYTLCSLVRAFACLLPFRLHYLLLPVIFIPKEDTNISNVFSMYRRVCECDEHKFYSVRSVQELVDSWNDSKVVERCENQRR